MENNISIYNVSEDFKKKVEPLLEEVQLYCIMNHVPFFMTFAISSTERDTTYKTLKQFPTECERTLNDDLLRRIGLAEMKFDLVMNNYDQFDMDEDVPPLPSLGKTMEEVGGEDIEC